MLSKETLLEQTLQRAALLVLPDRTPRCSRSRALLLRLTTLVATARTLFLGGEVYRRRFVHKGRIRR